jgi:hypothetical protein
MSLLALALLLGLVAAGSVDVIRAVLMEVRPMWLLVKPWSCSLCMSWWCSVAAVTFYGVTIGLTVPDALLATLASTAVSLGVVRGSNRLAE